MDEEKKEEEKSGVVPFQCGIPMSAAKEKNVYLYRFVRIKPTLEDN